MDKPTLIIGGEELTYMMQLINVSGAMPIAGVGTVEIDKSKTSIRVARIALVPQERNPSFTYLTPEAKDINEVTSDWMASTTAKDIRLRWCSTLSAEPKPIITHDLIGLGYDWFIFVEANARGKIAARLEVYKPLRISTEMDIVIDYTPDATRGAYLDQQISTATHHIPTATIIKKRRS